jgi:hypothetical protein
MHGEQTVEDLRRDEIVVRMYKLDPHDHCFDPTEHEKDQRIDDYMMLNRCDRWLSPTREAFQKEDETPLEVWATGRSTSGLLNEAFAICRHCIQLASLNPIAGIRLFEGVWF